MEEGASAGAGIAGDASTEQVVPEVFLEGRDRIQEGPTRQRDEGVTSREDRMMGAKVEPHLIHSEKSENG